MLCWGLVQVPLDGMTDMHFDSADCPGRVVGSVSCLPLNLIIEAGHCKGRLVIGITVYIAVTVSLYLGAIVELQPLESLTWLACALHTCTIEDYTCTSSVHSYTTCLGT